MPTYTNLYLSTRWDLDDIKRTIENHLKTHVTVESEHKISVGFFTFIFDSTYCTVHSCNTPIGRLTLLSMMNTKQNIEKLQIIAGVLGGLFTDDSINGKYEMIVGLLDEGDKLSYHLKDSVICADCDGDNLNQIVFSVKRWNERMKGF